jgi:multicomponent Na+:H+ antiporter subunit G
MIEWLTATLLFVGTVFMLLAAIGVVRMPDLFTRMHAATKMPTLAMSCILLAVAVHFQEIGVVTRALLGIAFFFLTVPVAAHMIGRVAHLTGVPLWRRSVMDELRDEGGPRSHGEGEAGNRARREGRE